VRRVSLLLAAALAALLAAAPAEASEHRRPAKRQLTTFGSCASLVAFAERRARRFGTDAFSPRRPVALPPPLVRMPVAARPQADGGGPEPVAAPVEGTDFSGTNVQEAGVDEPDAVKTDGRRLYVAIGRRLHAIDLTGDAPRLVASITLEGWSHELLLRGDRLLVISSGGFDGPLPSFAPYAPRTTLLEVDARDLRVVRTVEVPGSVVGGRLRGSTARIAISTPTGVAPEGAPPLRRWLPAMATTRAATGRTLRRSVAPCTAVRRPAVFAGLGLLTVLTIDLDRGAQPVDADAVLADATTVYASPSRMYLATERWVDPEAVAEDGLPAGRSTTVHAFDVGRADATAYAGSGSVRGYLLNQFSLSEHRGALRVATTDAPPWLGGANPERESESFVTVLDEAGGRLVRVGRVGGLGRGERIYAVRFAGDVGFVVTFREIDPLYTLDLSERTNPRVVGELKIPGFSTYLHPIGDDLLLGLGQDADSAGRPLGPQVSLFDVSNLRDPRRLHQRRLAGPDAYTAAEDDHHAFLWWAPARLLVLPLSDYGERGGTFEGAVGLRVDRAAGFSEAGRTEHPEVEGARPPVVRALVASGRLYTISSGGVLAGSLDTLAGAAWVPFPQD
jgi:hypothetical protein